MSGFDPVSAIATPLISTAVGGLFGATDPGATPAQGTGTQTIINQAQPSPIIAPALSTLFNAAQSNFTNGPIPQFFPGQTTAQINPVQQQALEAMFARAVTGNPLTTQAQQQASNFLAGNFMPGQVGGGPVANVQPTFSNFAPSQFQAPIPFQPSQFQNPVGFTPSAPQAPVGFNPSSFNPSAPQGAVGFNPASFSPSAFSPSQLTMDTINGAFMPTANQLTSLMPNQAQIAQTLGIPASTLSPAQPPPASPLLGGPTTQQVMGQTVPSQQLSTNSEGDHSGDGDNRSSNEGQHGRDEEGAGGSAFPTSPTSTQALANTSTGQTSSPSQAAANTAASTAASTASGANAATPTSLSTTNPGIGGNPFLGAMFNAASQGIGTNFANNVMPGINSAFSLAGRFGSGAQQTALSNATQNFGSTLGNMGANLFGNAFALERQLMQQANMFNSAQQLQNNQFNATGAAQNSQFNTGLGANLGMFNANLGQANNQFNAANTTQNNQFNSGLGANVGMFNANLGQANNQFNTGLGANIGMFNNQLGQANSIFNAGANLQNNQFMTGLNQANSLFNSQANLQNNQFNAGAANTLGIFNTTAQQSAFQNAQNRMLMAMGMAPGLAAQDFTNINALMGVGNMQQAQTQANLATDIARFNFNQATPMTQLQNLSNILQGFNLPTSSTQTGTTNATQAPANSPFAGAIGGALAGNAIGNLFSSPAFTPTSLASTPFGPNFGAGPGVGGLVNPISSLPSFTPGFGLG